MQQITISGYLSKDAETRDVRGKAVASLNIPVKQGWGDREQTNWYRASVWGKRADFAGKLTKGTFVVVTGDLSIGEYNGKPQYEINVSDFQHAGGSNTGSQQHQRSQGRQSRQDDGWGGGDGWEGDEGHAPF